jgi:hypothetical protein
MSNRLKSDEASRTKSNLILSPLLAVLVTACSSQSGQSGDNQKTPASSKVASEDAEETGDGQESDSGDADATSADADKVFSLFCERAAETKVVQEELGEQFDKLCQDGKPTKLLATVLVKSAFSGSGEPSLKKVAEWEEDKEAKTTSGFFGVGIKLPIGIDQHFDTIAVKGGEQESIDAMAEASGGVAEISKVLEEHKADGPYHVRGWTIESKASRQVEAIKMSVSTHTVARSDQFELEKGSVYLYTQYLVESKQTIKDLKMVTAGLKVGQASYLLTVSRVEIENKGFHPVAMSSIRQSAAGLTKAMYEASKEDN